MDRTFPLSRYSAGHPLRRQLAQTATATRIASEDQDLKLFALSFTAFFICISAFIF